MLDVFFTIDIEVMLSHGSERLNQAKNQPDDVVMKRFQKLCSFLDRNRDKFCVKRFQGHTPRCVEWQPEPLVSPLWKASIRILEQAYRRKFQ